MAEFVRANRVPLHFRPVERIEWTTERGNNFTIVVNLLSYKLKY